MIYKASDIKWIKSVKHASGNGWAYLEYHDGAEFSLEWPVSLHENVKEPKVGDLILVFQSVNKSIHPIPGLYFSHLVTPIDNTRYEGSNPEFLWVRKCKVIFYAGIENLIMKPNDITFRNRAWGSCLKIATLLNEKYRNVSLLQSKLWSLFENDTVDIVDTELLNYKEGKLREEIRMHKFKERNRKFVTEFKFKNRNIANCPACNCNLKHDYNIPAIELLELHHIIPLSSRLEEYTMLEEDFILLCPNCHRAIHKLMSKYRTDKITLSEFKYSIKII